MSITKLRSSVPAQEISKPDDEALQNEYNYILAENMTRKLLEKGLISVAEFDKIMAKNRQTFSPFLARLCQ